jgi:hypothetical protein
VDDLWGDRIINDTEHHFYVGVGPNIGARVGAEILAGGRVGFTLDMSFRYAHVSTSSREYGDSYEYGSYGSYNMELHHELSFPVFGLGLGVAFYR